MAADGKTLAKTVQKAEAPQGRKTAKEVQKSKSSKAKAPNVPRAQLKPDTTYVIKEKTGRLMSHEYVAGVKYQKYNN
ncbi:unnamed protein product [Clonostachys chloroleuca]|uniref:Uncharacterized protein n=1 Tax=Clonostachys chloroleuca TaxID=1926264 RepID=A0AA35QBX6_9HYPO|nr:unnamed protein product [Clonostachys chloroleuca]